jgi:hypothetical protein
MLDDFLENFVSEEERRSIWGRDIGGLGLGKAPNWALVRHWVAAQCGLYCF